MIPNQRPPNIQRRTSNELSFQAPHNTVRYRLTRDLECFLINEVTGALTLKQSFLYEPCRSTIFFVSVWLFNCSCLTVSLIRQFLQQLTLNIFSQKMENLYNLMDNLWLKVENIVSKGEIARFEQFLLLWLFSKSRLLQRRQKASIWGKQLMKYLKWVHN